MKRCGTMTEQVTPPQISRQKRFWFHFIALIVLPLLFACLIETGLRLAGFGHNPAFFVPGVFTKDLVANPQFGQRFFPRAIARKPAYASVSSTRPENRCRVFVFGESAAIGDPDPKFGFSRILAVLLRDRHPDIDFEFINTAMVAINSHVVLPIANDCASLEGDFWLVYMGNNEPTGLYGASRIYSKIAPPLPVIRALLSFKELRAGQLLNQVAVWIGSENSLPTSWKGMEMQADRFIRQNDPQMQRIYSNFGSNLEDILRAGARTGAKTIVSTVAVNLKDCPPFISLHRSDLSEIELARWQKLFDAGVAAETAGEFDRAAQFYEQSIMIDDSHAEAAFRLARCCLKQGKMGEAEAGFKKARDLDALRFRADSAINEAIRKTAEQHSESGVRLVDAEEVFLQHSKEGPPGDEWFYEHVHFRFSGNYLLARLFADEIDLSLPKRLERFAARKGEWLSEEECAKRLAFTSYSQSSSLENMIARTERLPFTRQADHQQMIAKLRQEHRQLLPFTKSSGLNRDTERCRSALKAAPSDWILHNLLAYMLISSGNAEAAREEWQKVTQLAPDFSAAYHDLASLAFSKGDLAETEKLLLAALRLDEDSDESRRLLTQLRERQRLVPNAP